MTPPDHFADSREAVLKARALHRQAHAVIFDFDGLLVDTEYAIYSSWERVFASCGHPLPLDLFNQCLGSGYTHWNPGEHLEKLTGRTFDWETVNSRRQEEIVRDLEHDSDDAAIVSSIVALGRALDLQVVKKTAVFHQFDHIRIIDLSAHDHNSCTEF